MDTQECRPLVQHTQSRGKITVDELLHLTIEYFIDTSDVYLYLTSGIEALSRLEGVLLAKNHLGSLPSGLYRLPALRVLELSGNRLTGLPEGLGDALDGSCLTALTSLSLAR